MKEKKQKKTKIIDQQQSIIVMVAMFVGILLLVVLMYTSFSGSDLSTRVVQPATKCADGTLIGSCSRTKPNKCQLVNNKAVYKGDCNACGCPSGKVCKATTGKCEKQEAPGQQAKPTKCGDGTQVGSCKSKSPYMCMVIWNTAVFKPYCSRCGCPAGSVCDSSSQMCR